MQEQKKDRFGLLDTSVPELERPPHSNGTPSHQPPSSLDKELNVFQPESSQRKEGASKNPARARHVTSAGPGRAALRSAGRGAREPGRAAAAAPFFPAETGGQRADGVQRHVDAEFQNTVGEGSSPPDSPKMACLLGKAILKQPPLFLVSWKTAAGTSDAGEEHRWPRVNEHLPAMGAPGRPQPPCPFPSTLPPMCSRGSSSHGGLCSRKPRKCHLFLSPRAYVPSKILALVLSHGDLRGEEPLPNFTPTLPPYVLRRETGFARQGLNH
uniref:uncharacterized protein LOC123455993 n=1 Tax=Jaculus jaculus TaxID=51337 RepID=UPI001E1B59BA|nr:uncharacterized protein LOC123455993 [Jaculus jaculus]